LVVEYKSIDWNQNIFLSQYHNIVFENIVCELGLNWWQKFVSKNVLAIYSYLGSMGKDLGVANLRVTRYDCSLSWPKLKEQLTIQHKQKAFKMHCQCVVIL